jgi:hypothetical protein
MQSHAQDRKYWYSGLPQGSLGPALIIVAAGAAWAHESAPTAVAWALTTAAAVAWVGAITWCALPTFRAQREPVLRHMGFTPWPAAQGRRPQSADERERHFLSKLGGVWVHERPDLQ